MGLRASNLARGQIAQQDAGSGELARALRSELGDPGLDPQAFLGAVFELQPSTWLRRMPGRETFAHGESIVLKRYRGDAWAEWLHAWMCGRERCSPARREGLNLTALHALGLCVPRALAWCEEDGARCSPLFARGRNARSAVAMELLPHSEHLRRCLSRSNAQEVNAWLAPLAQMVAHLHREHWFHRDLYLQHFAVLDPVSHRLALLDCGRARNQAPVPTRWIVKDLAQLLHSCPSNLAARTKLRWLVLYARERSPARAIDLRVLVRAVVAKELRMRAHRPRHLDPGTAHPDGSER